VFGQQIRQIPSIHLRDETTRRLKNHGRQKFRKFLPGFLPINVNSRLLVIEKLFKMSQIHGLPPLPKCFDGLIRVERTVSETSGGDIKEGTIHILAPNYLLNTPDKLRNESSDSTRDCPDMDAADEDDNVIEESASANFEDTPYSKLNYALSRLRNEMVMLSINVLFKLRRCLNSSSSFKIFLFTNVIRKWYKHLCCFLLGSL
jgi:hypothetical protein